MCNNYFEEAKAHLKDVFAKYPFSQDMKGFPCCIGESPEAPSIPDEFPYYIQTL
jgi:hypothetical protein